MLSTRNFIGIHRAGSMDHGCRSRWIIGARRLRQERRLARQPFDDARQRFPALQGLTQALDDLLGLWRALEHFRQFPALRRRQNQGQPRNQAGIARREAGQRESDHARAACIRSRANHMASSRMGIETLRVTCRSPRWATTAPRATGRSRSRFR
ncbi:MAG: hypothetical protein H6R24_2733 [Proteobacteria bacterium]|nr:hypothetical protein [Pseudomonadota bacterium]